MQRTIWIQRDTYMAYDEVESLLQYYQQQLIDNPFFSCLTYGFGKTNKKHILD